MRQSIQPQRTSSNTGSSRASLTSLKEMPTAILPNQKTPCVERILWKSKNSVFRIIPGVDDSGNILHQINDPMEMWDSNNPGKHLSDTFYSCRILENFNGSPIIVELPPGSDESSMYAPLDTFSRIIHNSVDASRKGVKVIPHPMWKQWIDYRDGKLSWVTTAVMMQALMWVVNDVQVSGEESQEMIYGLVCLTHGPSISRFLEDATRPMDQRRPMSAVDNSNLGPIAEADGCWLYMNSSQFVDKNGQTKTILAPSYAPNGADMRTVQPTMMPLDENTIKALWKPWGSLLKFYTMEEQFRLLSQNFGPDTVNYVFKGRDVEQFIPMDIQQAGLGRYESLGGASAGRAQRTRVPAIAPGAPAPVAPAMSAPAAPVYEAPKVAPIPKDASVGLPPLGAPAIPSKPVVPKQMQAKVDEAKAAALRAGVTITPPSLKMQNPMIPSIPGTTPSMAVPKIGLAPEPPVTPKGASADELQALVQEAQP